MPLAKVKQGKDMGEVPPPFEYKFITKTLIQYSLRPNHLAILGVDEFKEKYELVDETPNTDAPSASETPGQPS